MEEVVSGMTTLNATINNKKGRYRPFIPFHVLRELRQFLT
jgi:hypothetical protein